MTIESFFAPAVRRKTREEKKKQKKKKNSPHLAERRVVEAARQHRPRRDVRRHDLEHDRPVRAQDLRPGAHVLRELLVAHRDEPGPPLRLVVGRDRDLLAGDEPDRPLVLEEARADLGALGVEHDGAHDPGVFAGDAERVEGFLVIFVARFGGREGFKEGEVEVERGRGFG